MIDWWREFQSSNAVLLVPITVFGLAIVARVFLAIFGGRCPSCKGFKKMRPNGESDWRKGWFRSVEFHQWECLRCGHTYWRRRGSRSGGFFSAK